MPLKFVEPPFNGLRKIISGGQTGADQGGLSAATRFEIETGGTVPKGWRTVKGPMPWLEKYGMVEADTVHYFERTKKNIVDSNGTVIIASNVQSAGSVQTAKICKIEGKPCLTLAISRIDEKYAGFADTLTKWIIAKRIEVLNVAGNRDMLDDLHHQAAYRIIGLTCRRLLGRKLLIKRSP